MKAKLTPLGYLGLLVGLGAAVFALLPGAAPQAVPQEQPKPPERFEPTERIDVERGIDFPYDI